MVSLAADKTKGLGSPGIAFNDVTVDLGSYLRLIAKAAGKVGDVFDAAPLGTLVDVATAAIPVIDGVNRRDLGLGLDTVAGDGKVTLADLVVYAREDLRGTIEPWYKVVAIIDILRGLGKLDGDVKIKLGSGTVEDGKGSFESLDFLDQLRTALKSLAGLDEDAVKYLTDFDSKAMSAKIAQTFAAEEASGGGFRFGLLEDPGKVIDLLLGKDNVSLVDVAVAAAHLRAVVHQVLPDHRSARRRDRRHRGCPDRLRPGLRHARHRDEELFRRLLHLDREGRSGHAAEHRRLSVPADRPGHDGAARRRRHRPWRRQLHGRRVVPVRHLCLSERRHGRALSADFVEGINCIFDPIAGVATVEANARLVIDFTFFTYKKNFPIASTTLATFEKFVCPHPDFEVVQKNAPGLATLLTSGEVRLNVGLVEGDRLVPDGEGAEATLKPVLKMADDPGTPDRSEVDDEAYVVARARDTSKGGIAGGGTTSTLVDGKLDIYAFGFTQRIVAGKIVGDFGAGNDALIIQDDVTNDFDVQGGAGDDNLVGGRGRDTFHGGADNDVLTGGDGDDFVYGDAGADQLSGGRGADVIDGGDGSDTVDYSAANADLKIGVKVTISQDGKATSSGGEADGDKLSRSRTSSAPRSRTPSSRPR
ncbi:calcium-binding protein [Sphingomonas sp. MMS24-JH45]